MTVPVEEDGDASEAQEPEARDPGTTQGSQEPRYVNITVAGIMGQRSEVGDPRRLFGVPVDDSLATLVPGSQLLRSSSQRYPRRVRRAGSGRLAHNNTNITVRQRVIRRLEAEANSP